MFTSLKQPNRYTKCTKKTLIKQTLVCRRRRMSANIKTSIFLDFLLFDLNQPLSHLERNRKKNLPYVFFAEEKIHNLPVESDQCFKVHCL